MCGILGSMPATEISLFNRALDLLSHRGPDGSGIWSESEEIRLGHRRLAILDLTQTGHQPMLDNSGRYVIVFNGELYNFVEIRKELEKRGHVFRSKSDTEIVLSAYVEWGESCLSRFNGMWAFAIWDRIEKCLFMSRDRFGKKPLFYAMLPKGGIVFASEMKAIYPFLKSVQSSRKINKYFHFLFDYEHTSECVIEGIMRIPPGHNTVYKNGILKIVRWWNTLDHIEEPPLLYDEQVERWRELFLDAVRIRMRSDVPIGTALSGGLDSSATFSAMAHIGQDSNVGFLGTHEWQHGFCSHFPGSSLDELQWAKLVTDNLNIPLDVVSIDPVKVDWTIEEALYQVEDPYLTLPLPMLATYQAISRAGIKVTLDGHGADELFSGYGHLRRACLSGSPEQVADIMAIQESSRTGRFSPDYKHSRIQWLKERALLHLSNNLRYPRHLAKSIVLGMDWDIVFHNLSFEDQAHPGFRQMDPLSRGLYELFHVTVLPTLLRNYDRYSMASGVEIRMPFMDWRLVAFTFSLPWTSKVGEGYTKRIMRDALKGIVSEEIRTRRCKIGWNAPLHEWFKGPLKADIDSYISNKVMPSSFKSSWKALQESQAPIFMDGQKVWEQLMPYYWHDSLQCNRV